MPISTRFYAGQTDYIDQLNVTVDEIGGGGVTSVGATSPVVSSGGTTPTISMPAATSGVNGYLTSANWTTFNSKAGIADITVTNLSGTVGFSKGGTGQITQQAAINALTAGVISGTYLRGNGTNVVMSTIQAADVPTLNQSTTGTAAIATTATTTNDVATASTVYPLWSSATSGNNGVKTSSTKLSFVPSTGILTATGFAGSGASLTSIPNGALTNSSVTIGSTSIALGATVTTFAGLTSITSTTFVGALTGNASTATTAGNVTGIVASANGGTGVNNGSSTITLGGNLTMSGAFASTFTVTGITSVTFPTSGTLLSTAAAVTVAQGGTGLTTLTANNVILGNGTSSPTFVAPSTSGNVLTSNGTTWVSSPAAGGGSAITVKDEGVNLTTSLTSLDFVGAGVTASNTGGAVTVTITGGGGSGGTVTSASVVSANGFAGTVANATTTPAITLTTTVTGILQGNGTAISAASATGSGDVVLATSPTLITPVLGVAAATSVNKVSFTAPTTGSTLTIVDGKTLTASNTLTFSGTDGSTLNIGTGGTLGTAAYTASTAYAPAAGSGSVTTLGTVTSGTWNGSIVGSTYGGTGVNNGGNTLTLGGNHTNSGAYASTFTFTGTTTVTFPTTGTVITTTNANFGGNSISGIKSASMDAETITTTSGAITLDFSTSSLKIQNELTGNVTYTFTAPPANTRIQILILSDGTSGSFTITYPANVKWYSTPFTTTTANKGAMINAFYDGTNYHIFGTDEK